MNDRELAQILSECDADMREAAAFWHTPRGQAQLRAEYERIQDEREAITRRIIAAMYAEDDLEDDL